MTKVVHEIKVKLPKWRVYTAIAAHTPFWFFGAHPEWLSKVMAKFIVNGATFK